MLFKYPLLCEVFLDTSPEKLISPSYLQPYAYSYYCINSINKLFSIFHLMNERYSLCVLFLILSRAYFHFRHIIETSIKDIKLTSLSLSSFVSISSIYFRKPNRERLLEKGTGECLLHIIPLMVVILQGQCNIAPKSPFVILNKKTIPLLNVLYDMQPEERQSIKFQDQFSLYHTSWNGTRESDLLCQ